MEILKVTILPPGKEVAELIALLGETVKVETVRSGCGVVEMEFDISPQRSVDGDRIESLEDEVSALEVEVAELKRSMGEKGVLF